MNNDTTADSQRQMQGRSSSSGCQLHCAQPWAQQTQEATVAKKQHEARVPSVFLPVLPQLQLTAHSVWLTLKISLTLKNFPNVNHWQHSSEL